MNKKRASTSSLITLILLFMLAYILLIPSDQKQILLQEKIIPPKKIEPKNILLSKTPGYINQKEITTQIPSIELFSSKKTTITDLINFLRIEKTLSKDYSKEIHFSINKEQLSKLQLHLIITNSRGSILIELNQKILYLGKPVSTLINIPLNYLQKNNTLKFSSIQDFIWSSSYSTIKNIKLIKTYKIKNLIQENTFELPENIKTSTLTFFIPCPANQNLYISINNNQIFSKRPLCNYLTQLEIPLKYLKTQNKITFKINQGKIKIKNIKIYSKLLPKKLSYPFKITQEQYYDIKDNYLNIILTIDTKDYKVRDQITIYINNNKIFQGKVKDLTFLEISDHIKKGINRITIDSKDTFKITNLTISLQ